MFNLEDRNISYLIISPEKKSNSIKENKVSCDKACSILYSKDYTVIPITGYRNGTHGNSFIAISNDENNALRKDAIYLLDELYQDSLIVKYKNESLPKKISYDGSEKLVKPVIYELNESDTTYVYNGLSFSFIEQRRYKFLSNKSELRKGMIVEFLNNEKWVEKQIADIDTEYDKMYKLLMRYGKLRTCIS